MKSIIVCPDIHGLSWWKDIKNRVIQGEHVVFLGDYVDPYVYMRVDDLKKNLDEIIEFKKQYPDNVTLLLGNHDLHYIYPEEYSASRYCYDIESYMNKTIEEGILNGLFQVAVVKEICGREILFTHAGVSRQWLTEVDAPVMEVPGVDYNGNDINVVVYDIYDVCDFLNEMLRTKNKNLMDCGPYRWGWCQFSGPVWLDINEVNANKGLLSMPEFLQIVGHTRLNNNVFKDGFGDGDNIFCTDVQHPVTVDYEFLCHHFTNADYVEEDI